MVRDGTGRRALVLGGARSGKSAFAEKLVAATGGTVVYVATAAAGDGEMADRIARHRAARDPRWRTIEEPLDLAATLRREAEGNAAILVDCLTLWLSNLIGAGRDVAEATSDLADCLSAMKSPVVLVSNEVGEGIVPANALSRGFRDDHGRLNQAVADVADQVVLMVAGQPLLVKPATREIRL